MEFKLIINNSEIGMLISIFNIEFKDIQYRVIEQLENETAFMVISKEENYDIMESLMEKLSSVKIEESILCKLQIIKKVHVYENGLCDAIDEDGNQITELKGLWKNKYKDIMIQANEHTIFQDERIAK